MVPCGGPFFTNANLTSDRLCITNLQDGTICDCMHTLEHSSIHVRATVYEAPERTQNAVRAVVPA